MAEQTVWAIVIAVVVVGVIAGFLIGRASGAAKKQLKELEDEVAQQKEVLGSYKQDVKAHFDKSATLFAAMAGSYKELFDHLSKGYKNLADDSTQDVFKERFEMLQGGQKKIAPSDVELDQVRIAEAKAQPDSGSLVGEPVAVSETKPAPVDHKVGDVVDGLEKPDEAAADTGSIQAERAEEADNKVAKPSDDVAMPPPDYVLPVSEKTDTASAKVGTAAAEDESRQEPVFDKEPTSDGETPDKRSV